MGTKTEISEAGIRQLASAESFRRGQDYFENGSVENLIRRGNRLYAEVEGSEPDPYEVSVNLDNITDYDCTCPYDWGGACKHIVAVLLAYMEDPQDLEERPPVDAVLDNLDRDQLLSLTKELVKAQPNLTGYVEAIINPPPAEAGTTSASAAFPPVNLPAVQKLVKAAFRAMKRSSYGDFPPEIDSLLTQAEQRIEAGDGQNAILILEAVTESSAAHLFDPEDYYEYYDESDEGSMIMESLGELWCNALLSTELTQGERDHWRNQLAAWDSDAGEIGLDGYFKAAMLAAEQGWDFPPLVRVLQGDLSGAGLWPEDSSWGRDELAQARLRILERQGRLQEYLYLAEAERQVESLTEMLIRLGRVPEAVAYGTSHTLRSDQALMLAKALQESGHLDDALNVAEKQVELNLEARSYDGTRSSLIVWLRDTAKSVGQSERALAAAETAFRENISLANYLAVQDLVGKNWPELQSELLDLVRKDHRSYYPQEHVQIFLREGLLEDAMKMADARSQDSIVLKVVEAAIPTHPDWVFRACKKQFDLIADAKQSQHYDEAVQWLARAKKSLILAGREDEWKAYFASTLERHAPKYKLVPMLRKLE